MKGRLKQW